MKIVLFLLALFLLIAQEYLKIKFNLSKHSKRVKELSERIKKEGISDELLKELLNVQRTINNYMVISFILFIFILFLISSIFSKATYVIKNNAVIIRGYSDIYSINGKLIYGKVIKDPNIIKEIINNKTKITPVYIILPFNIPVLNRNWLGALGTFFLYYFLLSFIFNIIKNILIKYGKWVKE